MTIISELFGKSENLKFEFSGLDNSATMELVPDSDITTNWYYPVAPADHYTEIDEDHASPTADYIQASQAAGDDNEIEEFTFNLTKTDVVSGSVTSFVVWTSIWDVNTNGDAEVSVSWDGGTSLEAYQALGNSGGYNWVSKTFTPSSRLNLKDVWDFRVRYRANVAVLKDYVSIRCVYVVVNYTSTPFLKYSARDFKGSFCIDLLNKMCKLEGAHSAEDHKNETIIIAKPDDFEDSGVDLDSNDYEHDWEFDDLSNSVKSVTVFGNAALEIEAESTGDVDSLIHKQIIDEGVATFDNALAIAEAEVAKHGTKAPNIKLTLNGVQSDLKVISTVDITFERPTIAKTPYPIRKIERSPRGQSGIKTTLWCGLGQSTAPGDKIGEEIVKASYDAHDAHQARLIATEPRGN